MPRLGAIGAQRLTDFLAQHPDTLGYLSPSRSCRAGSWPSGTATGAGCRRRRGAARGAPRAGRARRLGRPEPRAGARAPGRTGRAARRRRPHHARRAGCALQ
nr:hypothetical protein [Burkholderia ubonensis]